MRKLLLLISSLSINSMSYSQLFVSSDNFIYVKSDFIFVDKDIELEQNSFLYLRNEGQLLQGTTENSLNKGLGKLSVFQEGTSDNYDYNYWCSPVSNTSVNTGNESFGITMLHVPVNEVDSYPANILQNNYNGISSNGSLSIAAYWIWRYLSGSNYSEWIQSGAATNIATGQGFTMKGTAGTDNTNVGETTINNPGSAQRYDFRGKPNNGNITVNVGADKFTLTGNPYPSALHINAFLLDPSNSDCTGIAYYWEQDKSINSHYLSAYQGGYGTYAPISSSPNEYGIYVPATYNTYNNDGTINTIGLSSGLSIQRKYAPIGQGFMIKGVTSETPTAVILKNEHRVFYKESEDYSQFEKKGVNSKSSTFEVSNENYPSIIRINTTMNNEHTKQIALVLMSSASDNFDRGVDALSPVPESVPNDVYFFLDQKKYVIQGTNFDIDKRVKLGVKVTNSTTFKFDASLVTNFDENQNIYLYDALFDTYYDIKTNTYEVNLTSGIYDSRFEITFKNDFLNSNIENTIHHFIIHQNNNTQFLEVYNPKAESLKSICLFDLNGKKLFDNQLLGAELHYQFPTNYLAESLYFVELTTQNNQKITKKIIIKNK